MSQPDPTIVLRDPQLDFPVVGIGASAGGLKALLEFFGATDPQPDCAYVVVVHLSPEHESNVVHLLQAATAIPISAVKERTSIKRNHIYVISPNQGLAMVDGHIAPTPLRREKGPRFTIDRFFETLADAQRVRAICVVLSGTGSDGTIGVKSVKMYGGVTFAQSPDDAEYDSMPRNAIATGAVDFVMRSADIPKQLASVFSNAKVINLPQLEERPTAEDVAVKAEEALRDVLSIARSRTGHDFSHYKRSTVLRRLERRLQVTEVRDLPSYRDYMRQHNEEAKHLLRDLLISVTSFFRDAAAFQALETKVIPALFEGRQHGGKIRVWVVGCASGEEVYSIAMLLVERVQSLRSTTEINIFATDIDEEALAYARAGLYPESIREQVSPARLRRFFTKEQDGYRVQKSMREMVMFATHNVIQDPPFSKIDLISCRNLLIYLNRPVQSKVLGLLHFSLRPDGYLFLGMSESVDDEHDGFINYEKPARIFQQQPRARMSMLVSSLPTLMPVRRPPDLASAGRPLVSYAELHQRLLELYTPPSLIVDDRYEIVHVSENAGRFLQISGGEPSLNLLKIVPDELRLELRGALDHALQTMRSVERISLPMRRGTQVTRLDVKIHPVHEKTTARVFALVVFDETPEVASQPPSASPSSDRVVAGLEVRLHDTQAQLRAAIEQYEIQNEEFKASNEELQATNEELRATSEELETGKEELQSTNEELTTVNQELKNKVDETTLISDDLSNFINATEMPVIFVDREFRLMRFTPFAREIFNLIPADIGRPLLDISNRLAAPTLETDLADVFANLRVSEREVRAQNGRWYIERILPYRTKDDRIGGAVLTFIDISERREAEDVVKRNRTWLQVVVDSVRDYAIMTLTPEGRIESWNIGAQQMFGYSINEATAKHFEVLFVAEDRVAGVPQNELRTARETGRADDDRWLAKRDGSKFFASGVTAPLHDVALHGYVKIVRDLTQSQLATERREDLLQDVRDSRDAAEESNRLKDEFLATLSHELRNPLALMQMQSELLLRTPELRGVPKLVSAAQVIHQMVQAQTQFVEDMLDVSRARTGKLTIERQLVPLPLLIAESIGALRSEAVDNDITLDIHVTEEPLFVEADAVRVKQIAWNLVSNALKFTPRGGRIRVSLDREGEFARLVVEDTGQGIAPSLLPHVFEWFRQGDAGSTRRKGGMGIGLALVKQLVDLHGGRVQAHSDGEGKGARFTVCLPLQTSLTQSPRASFVHALPEERLAGYRVLVIDDAPANAEALRELLQLEGADTMLATSAHDALTHARDVRFDLIISDVAMPEVNGHQLLATIRKTTPNVSTPAIAYSGYGGPEDIARSKRAGFALHVTKPVDLDRLVASIRECIEASREQ
ncbi:MAG TPA: CheR family methyltransferase [Casimicrobiaceae bacterium]|nr:CheR family methyltransferase [Casimicrobiaceae bacterium]